MANAAARGGEVVEAQVGPLGPGLKRASTGSAGVPPSPLKASAVSSSSLELRTVVDELAGLAEQIRALQAFKSVHDYAREASDLIFTGDKTLEMLPLAEALSTLSVDYNGMAREIFGTLERHRRAMGLLSHTFDGAREIDPLEVEQLCIVWDSVITTMLELASRHSQIMNALAIDTEVYKRLSLRLLASQCYEFIADNRSRVQLISSAAEACESTSEAASTILAPIMCHIKETRKVLPKVRASQISASAKVQRFISLCPDLWDHVEESLGRSTIAVTDFVATLIRIRAKLKIPSEGGKSPLPSRPELDAVALLVREACNTTCAVHPTEDETLLRKAPSKVNDALTDDPFLRPYLQPIIERYAAFRARLTEIEVEYGGLDRFSRGYEEYGFHPDADSPGGLVFREWCPGVTGLALVGDFNGWDATKHVGVQRGDGDWLVTIPGNPTTGKTAIEPGSHFRLSITTADGSTISRIPAWLERSVQPEGQLEYVGEYTDTYRAEYSWKHPRPQRPAALKIYEAHIGIASPKPAVSTYAYFTEHVIPRIAAQNYNCIQLMAVMEHAYYGSFGYQVTSFFAASSRYGTSDELCALVDAAHGAGLIVLLDVVHSHASKNTTDGLNMFNGTDGAYFRTGAQGFHQLWDSRLFDYGSIPVLRFLLSNLRYYIDRFKFDGFRFDGVTSMLYLHHGCYRTFTGYDDYFRSDDVDIEAEIYLMLANQLVHSLLPNGVTIAEDVSGLPLLCRSIAHGGIGFDYRLAMAVPDYWIKLLKEQVDEAWNMADLVHVLINRRYREPVIAYAESHDQALVGDKTLAFWLMDKDMYTNMSTLTECTPVIERGIAMHKMIRLITHTLAGEGYLNFIGNEFGHPEWLDFPRKENGESYHYARRQWNLVDDPLLRYKYLNEFDKRMNEAESEAGWLSAPQAFISLKHDQDKIIVFERAECIFIFNFHVHKSFSDYRIGAPMSGKYNVLLCTDELDFGGQARVASDCEYFSTDYAWHGRLVALPPTHSHAAKFSLYC